MGEVWMKRRSVTYQHVLVQTGGDNVGIIKLMRGRKELRCLKL